MTEAAYTPRDWHTQPAYLAPEYKSTVLRSPSKPLIPLPQSLSEITGPVFGHGADVFPQGRVAGHVSLRARSGEAIPSGGGAFAVCSGN